MASIHTIGAPRKAGRRRGIVIAGLPLALIKDFAAPIISPRENAIVSRVLIEIAEDGTIHLPAIVSCEEHAIALIRLLNGIAVDLADRHL
ncbi:hypothetical protein LJR034_000843 [Caballeronia sp. LjRoot34]|uniref:hypothetical protein n=1 Tax=Caballeronia sp. LjRoot34 TaxID=3342325 RepID=UPI003ECF9DCC